MNKHQAQASDVIKKKKANVVKAGKGSATGRKARQNLLI